MCQDKTTLIANFIGLMRSKDRTTDLFSPSLQTLTNLSAQTANFALKRKLTEKKLQNRFPQNCSQIKFLSFLFFKNDLMKTENFY